MYANFKVNILRNNAKTPVGLDKRLLRFVLDLNLLNEL